MAKRREMFDQISYRGNTTGHAPMLFLMRLTLVGDERTAELVNTADFRPTRAEFPNWASRWPTATPPLPPRLLSKEKTCLVCGTEGVVSTLGWKEKGSSFFLITQPVKSFGAPPAAASLSPVSKCCHRGRRMPQNNPHFVTRWFMIIVLPW